MRKKCFRIIILSMMFCLIMGLAACSKKEPSYDLPALQSVSISNKTALQADWYEGGEDRKVEYTLAPGGLNADNTDVVVSSNRPQIISVDADGVTIKPIGAGTATVTVTADGLSDSVIITVKPILREVNITNKTELAALWVQGDGERSVSVALSPDAFTEDNTTVVVSSSDSGVISVDGKTLSAEAVGKSTITVTAGDYSDSVNMEVIALSAPTFEVDGEETAVKGAINSAIKLPVVAMSCDGKNLADNVTITCADNSLVYDKANYSVTVTEKGDYDLTLTVADPRDPSLTDSVNLTVTAYRKIFNKVDGYGMSEMQPVFEEGKEFTDDDRQSVFFNRTDATFAQFDMQPSKTYYAEVTITSPVATADWSTYYGMTHSVKDDTTRWLTSFIDRGDAEGSKGARNFRVKFSDVVEDNEWWNLNESTSRTPLYYSYRIYQHRELNDGGSAFPLTLAVARIGEFFYSFVNGDYVNCVTNKNFSDVDTIPGVYQQSSIRAYYTNIVWMSGADAENKVNALIGNGKNIVSAYVPDTWANGSKNTNNKNFTAGEVTADNGINYEFTNSDSDWNGGMVSPYIYFDGDFKFEWTFEFDKSVLDQPQKDLMRMWLDVRGYNYTSECLVFGASYGKKDSADPSKLFAAPVTGSGYRDFWHFNGTDSEWGAWWDGKWSNTTHKFKFQIARICMQNDDGTPLARYIMTFTAIDQRGSTGEGQSKKFVWDWDGYGSDGKFMWDPCEPVILVLHHVGIKGKCTNMKWDVLHNSVDITNKSELNHIWTVGDSHEIKYALGDGMDDVTATVTSSDPTVIKVNDDGVTLTALKAGTVKITVSAGDGAIDTITLTVRPTLDSVTIANESALTARWVLGENARDVEITFDPSSHWNYDNSGYTVTSSDISVISVNGRTLTAVGSGTATITVTAAGKTATVQITVIPTLNSVTIANESALTARWVLGENARDVEITFDPSSHWNYDNSGYTVTSSNTSVITVNGRTLTAVGSGTATITVTAACKTATVQITVRPILTTFAISNKTALQAKWIAGDSDRTIEFSLTEYWTADNTDITITTSNESVISVDQTNKTIHAAGEGTATITVSYGTHSDNVEITVESGLKTVTISNKEDLTSLWLVNGSDRTVSLVYDPVDFTPNSGELSIVSDNTAAVTVDGYTLKAVGAGTAKITVTVGSRTDEVSITVRPELSAVSISNKADLEKTWNLGDAGRNIAITFDSAEYWNFDNADCTVSSSNTSVISVNGKTLTAVGKGEATITVSARNGKTDTVNINVTIGTPVIEITDDVQTVYAPTGVVTLPQFSAESYNGDDLTGEVKISCSDAKVTVNNDNTLTVAEKGVYTVKLTVIDSRDSTKSAEKTLTVNVMRNVFNAVNGASDKLNVSYELGDSYVNDANQVVYINGHSTKIAFGQFDMTPSKQYYASVTFTAQDDANEYLIYGMSHSEKGNTPTKWLSFFVDRDAAAKGRNAKIKYFDISGDSDWQTVDSSKSVKPIYMTKNIYTLRGLDSSDPFPVKYETVRNGDFFYFFINGQYVMGCTNDDLKDKDTLPGIFQFAWNTTGMTAIEWLSGNAAVNKFNTLTDSGKKLIDKYMHSDWVTTKDEYFDVNGSASDNVGFTYKQNNAQDDWNAGLITPYLYFDGDFSFEFTYKFTWARWAQNSRMTLNIANYNSTTAFIEYGAYATTNSNYSRLYIMKPEGNNYETGYNWNSTTQNGGLWGSVWNSSPEKIKFYVSRTNMTDDSGKPFARYTFIMTPLNIWEGTSYSNKNGTPLTYVFDWDGTGKDGSKSDPCGAVFLNFCHYNIAGVCSDISYSANSSANQSNNALIDGDFTLRYEYSFATGESGSNNWDKYSSLEIRNASTDKCIAKLNISPMQNGSTCVGLQVLKADANSFEDTGGVWNSNIGDKYTIEIKKTCDSNGSVTFAVKVWKGEINDTNKILDKTVVRSAIYGQTAANESVYIAAINRVSGTFSNMSLTTSAE